MINLSMNIMAGEIGKFAAASAATSTADYVNREAFDSFTGDIKVGGSSICITGINVNLSNETERRWCLFSRNAGGITDGIPDMTGEVSMYFTDADLSYNAFHDETQQNYSLRMVDSDGNAYAIEMTSVKYTGDTTNIGDIQVTASLPFRLEPTTGPELALRRQPAARD